MNVFKNFVFGVIFLLFVPAQGQSAPGEKPSGALEHAARFVSDVTVPDGTTFKAGESFVKTWRIRNAGTKTWSDYKFAFVKGSKMGAPKEVKVPATSPGEMVDISVSMTSPAELGSHHGRWQMKTPEGDFFGQEVFVLIMVQEKIATRKKSLIPTRPILYFDMDGQEWVISAVYPNGSREVGLVRGRERGCLTCLTAPVMSWSPKGDWFAYLTLDYEDRTVSFFLQNLKGELKTIDIPEFISGSPIWSPDGERIAFLGEGLVVFNVRKEAAIAHSLSDILNLWDRNGFMMRPNKFRWSPDGKKILLSWNKTIVVDDKTGGIETIADHPVFAEWGRGSDGVYFFDMNFKDEGKQKPQSWKGLYFQKLGGKKPQLLLDETGLEQTFGLEKEDIISSEMWPGFFKLSPKGSWLSVLTQKVEDKKSTLHLVPLPKGKMPSFKNSPRRIEIYDSVVDLQWSPTEEALAGIGMVRFGVNLLDLETEAWTRLTQIPANTTTATFYGMGAPGISWTD